MGKKKHSKLVDSRKRLRTRSLFIMQTPEERAALEGLSNAMDLNITDTIAVLVIQEKRLNNLREYTNILEAKLSKYEGEQ